MNCNGEGKKVVLRYAGYSQDFQVSVLYYNKVVAIFVLFQWKNLLFCQIISFPFGQFCFILAPATLSVRESDDEANT